MRVRFAVAALLLIQWWLMLSTLPVTAPTVDEPLHIVRGYAYAARGEDRLRLRGPVLANALSGAALLLEPGLQLPPPDDPIWLRRDDTALPEAFMWSNAAPPQRIVFWARLPIIATGLLLSALVFRWASERSGAWPALGSLAFCVFCPNLLAHARLATVDAVTTVTYFFAAYAFTRALDAPRPASRLMAGIAFGLALAAKFSSAALAAAFAVQATVRAWQDRLKPGERRSVQAPLMTTLVVFAVGGWTLWAIYRLKVEPLEAGGVPLPAPSYWGEWLALSEYLREPLPGYLFGEVSTRGWWYYYPITFLFKTPLPVLILLALAVVRTVRSRSWLRDMPLFLPPVMLLASLLFSPHDLGYRYLLPILPFIFVAGANAISEARRVRWARVASGGLIAWQVVGTLLISPYYLAFFNELAGGPDQGRFILSDSNLDWGQDLIGLKEYVDRSEVSDLRFSYFGNTDPAAYGLHAYALPPVRSAMHEQGAWWLHRYYPPDPPPGVYAISVSNLMGGIWIDQNAYAYFRERTPDTIIGHTIYVYTVPARGEPVDLSLSGLQIDQIDPAAYARFNTNDVRPRWFDARTSLIAAPGESWAAISDLQSLAPEFAILLDGVKPVARPRTVDDGQPYRLYRLDLARRMRGAAAQAEQVVQEGALPATFGHTAELIGYSLAKDSERPQGITLVTYWRAGDDVVTPLQLFVHAVNASDQIVAQEDRLDAPAFGWREGDTIAHVSRLALPAASDPISIRVGLYNADTGVRLPATIDGRVVGDAVSLKQSR